MVGWGWDLGGFYAKLRRLAQGREQEAHYVKQNTKGIGKSLERNGKIFKSLKRTNILYIMKKLSWQWDRKYHQL